MNISTKKSQSSSISTWAGFSLVEILVVISIIAALAALTVGLAGRAAEARKKSQVVADMAVIEMAIERYKEKLGFYPPDNTNNPARPPLFFELAGTRPSGSDYQPLNRAQPISGADIMSYFRLPGFANSQPGEAQNFLEQMKSVNYGEIKPAPGASNVNFLVVPVDGPGPDTDINNKPMNLWRYNSSHPTNNPGHFDLWAEVIIRGRTNIIGNWRN